MVKGDDGIGSRFHQRSIVGFRIHEEPGQDLIQRHATCIGLANHCQDGDEGEQAAGVLSRPTQPACRVTYSLLREDRNEADGNQQQSQAIPIEEV
jgi:hypothetical protein